MAEMNEKMGCKMILCSGTDQERGEKGSVVIKREERERNKCWKMEV